MRDFMPSRTVLLLVLVATVAVAEGPDDRQVIRTLQLSEHPSDSTHNIYVTGQVATVLRFDQKVDPTQTKLLGWEGRFEPLLVGGKKVIIEALRNLGRDEGVPLLVTLADGTEIPFLVRPPWSKRDTGWPPFADHQVNVFKDPESYNAMHSSLKDALKRERRLGEENQRLKQEENSVDHAFATLLVNGQVKETPFRSKQVVFLKDGDMDITVEVFSGPGKAAAVIRLTNTHNEEPWRFRDARLTSDLTSHTARPFALRMDRAELVQGQSGTIAVVADASAFTSKEGLRDLALEIFREDGLRQVIVNLDHTLLRQ